MRFLFVVVLAWVAAFSGLGSAASLPARPTSSTHARPPAAINLPDAQIERNIRAKLAKSKISVDRFTVKVSGGVAVLEGKTGVIQHKGVATRLAKSGGARAVQNQIQITEEARAKAAAKLAKYRQNGQLAKAVVVQPAKVNAGSVAHR